mmetsp:Transcript_3417/g.4939  ORF Transcript_3417/g.4939 Transcript_3417/m.4939 type:complete len:181 (-) Transcript_3417:147-689(-)
MMLRRSVSCLRTQWTRGFCKKLSHIDEDRNQPKMVDVGGKTASKRTAHARSLVALPKCIVDIFESPTLLNGPKGPVLTTAVISGVMAAKETSRLIPFCHPLPLDKVDIFIELDDRDDLVIDCHVSCTHKTGVEMEALTGASVAALAVYDMCKAMSHDIVIKETKLISKTGGKSDYNAKAE